MTPPQPSRTSLAGRAFNDLRNRARRDGRNPAEYFTLYALEGFLARLAASGHADDFVLKGGVLMAVFADRRPTRDIDLAARHMPNDTSAVEERVRSIVSLGRDDGLEFDLESVIGEDIRDQAEYPGVRVSMAAQLASAKVAIHVDVNFGDPIWPRPSTAELPLLLGGTLSVIGYPDHMVLAEKIVTALERGERNTRWRDFADIAALARSRTVDGTALQEAVTVVARYRQVDVKPLGPAVSRMPTIAQRKWEAWRRKQGLQQSTPESFGELLDSCLVFAEPVLENSVSRLRWSPQNQTWKTE